MVCSRQSIGWGGLWKSCCPSCQIFGAVRFEPKRSFLDSPRERRCSCAVDFWHIVVKPRRRKSKTTRTYYRFWKSRWNNELRCIGFGWLRSPISVNQESEDNIELLPLYHVPCVTLCTLSLSCQTTLTKRQKKKKDCQMSVYHKADPGELIQWVTHESRSSAASNSGVIRIRTQPRTADAWHQWLMPAARRRHPRFFGHFWPSVWPSSRSNFYVGPSPLDSTEKILHIRAYDFGVQFSFNVEKRRHLKMATQCCLWRAKSYPFCMPNAFCIQIWNSFVTFTAPLFPWTCIRPNLRVLHAWDIACKLPSNKGRTWIEASLKVEKWHKRHDFYTQLYRTLIHGQHTIKLPGGGDVIPVWPWYQSV